MSVDSAVFAGSVDEQYIIVTIPKLILQAIHFNQDTVVDLVLYICGLNRRLSLPDI